MKIRRLFLLLSFVGLVSCSKATISTLKKGDYYYVFQNKDYFVDLKFSENSFFTLEKNNCVFINGDGIWRLNEDNCIKWYNCLFAELEPFETIGMAGNDIVFSRESVKGLEVTLKPISEVDVQIVYSYDGLSDIYYFTKK